MRQMKTAGQPPFGPRSSADDVVKGLDLTGRTIVVTGANTGIGEPTARALAGAGARVVFACRQRATGEAAVARARLAHPGCRAEFAQLDLASFASIRGFTEQLEAASIDALICNAGLAAMAYEETDDGFERTVGVCHIGHFLLARLLMPRLLASRAARVVMVSSTSHRSPAKLDFDHLPLGRADFNGMRAYGQAKLCNVLMAKTLQQRYGDRGLTACALHPGTLITTNIGRGSKVVGALIKLVSPFTKNPSQGAATTVWATVHEPASQLAGQYLQDCRVASCSREADDPAVAEKLWQHSEGWLERAGALPAWP
jgi:NAD(P)-dependent dehydrogenase (short-subunit alcohol dehydrogenase family)